jgi:hypothetical protein
VLANRCPQPGPTGRATSVTPVTGTAGILHRTYVLLVAGFQPGPAWWNVNGSFEDVESLRRMGVTLGRQSYHPKDTHITFGRVKFVRILAGL